MNARSMTIWIDGDGFPRQLRDIALRAADRTGLSVVLAADRALPVKVNEKVQMVVVEQGDDEADRYIAQHVKVGDIVCSRDIYLMERCIEAGAVCMDDRGNLYTESNIRERVSIRKMMGEYRQFAGDAAHGGNNRFTSKEVKAFADLFDSFLTKKLNS